MTDSTPHHAAAVLGAILSDARRRRFMLREEPAVLLGVSPDTVAAIEDGTHRIGPAAIATLTALYRFEPAWALQRLLAFRTADNTAVRDDEPGHAARLAACARQAARVRWLSTLLLPPPVQTPHYAQAVAEHSALLPGAPQLPPADTVYILDSHVIDRGSGTPAVMAEQLNHLLRMVDRGTEIRIVPPDHPFPQPPGHLVEMALPTGHVLARPGPDWVDYHRPGTWSARIDDAFHTTDPPSSRALLEQAARQHTWAALPVHGPQ
ncbi:Scr1 family TA system antitoxin-like transcriptional regulator [Streptomyces sp. BE147]|uniref:helix-turn-helix domain-containing protein n=1 Tax=Streptomyces sp. BE147 TaxID=3002524 RepID=UPI002E7669D7|nr:Scr1 family TA system antitoxin-like transcriptional regulator [Streptomyces sp. BE147]MEE1736484.1 Scr1 family TA system antitoxin-like transcriptional regulator [Streptomyces sp. BE147]